MGIRVIPIRQSRFGCPERLPVMTEGGICLRETPCIFPRGHHGPHRNIEGSVSVNRLDMKRQLGG